MAEQLKMLALSPTMEQGIIARWNKQEGDKIASGDVLCEVETDKAAMDYESSTDGVLLKILIKDGETASIGDPIAIVGKEGEDISGLVAQPEASAPSEKTGMIRSTPLARKIAQTNDLDMKQIEGSGPEGRIVKADVEKALAGVPAAKTQSSKPETVADKPVTEAAQTEAEQLKSATSAKPTESAKSSKPAATVSVSPAQGDTVIPVSGKRRVIAQRLSESMFSAPHYYLKVPVLMDDLIAARNRLNAGPDTKVSMNAFLIKFAAEALKRHPMVNTSWAVDTMVQHGSIDIGLAVAQTDGLITPVVRDCGNKGIFQIDREMKDLIEKARSNSLKPEEYTGATFTISNLGSYGIEEFTAIINPPGSAILAVGEIRKEPVVQLDDTLKVQSVMKLTLSCDHRVIDGSVGAAFLTDLRKILEEPVRALY